MVRLSAGGSGVPASDAPAFLLLAPALACRGFIPHHQYYCSLLDLPLPKYAWFLRSRRRKHAEHQLSTGLCELLGNQFRKLFHDFVPS